MTRTIYTAFALLLLALPAQAQNTSINFAAGYPAVTHPGMGANGVISGQGGWTLDPINHFDGIRMEVVDANGVKRTFPASTVNFATKTWVAQSGILQPGTYKVTAVIRWVSGTSGRTFDTLSNTVQVTV